MVLSLQVRMQRCLTPTLCCRRSERVREPKGATLWAVSTSVLLEAVFDFTNSLPKIALYCDHHLLDLTYLCVKH